MVQVTINSIQKEYILIDQNQRFGQRVQVFIDETNPFGNSSITYMNNNLSFIEQDYDEFLMDVLYMIIQQALSMNSSKDFPIGYYLLP